MRKARGNKKKKRRRKEKALTMLPVNHLNGDRLQRKRSCQNRISTCRLSAYYVSSGQNFVLVQNNFMDPKNFVKTIISGKFLPWNTIHMVVSLEQCPFWNNVSLEQCPLEQCLPWNNVLSGTMSPWNNVPRNNVSLGTMSPLEQCLLGTVSPWNSVSLEQCLPWSNVSLEQCLLGTKCP